jgi:protein O-GlcNAc transferase
MPDPRPKLERARSAYAAGDLRSAARACEQLLTADPRNLDARHLLGRCLAAQAKWPEAAAQFRRALATDGRYLPALIDLGITEALAGRYSEAQAALEQALALDSRPAEVYFGLGLCRLHRGDPTGAVPAFREATRRNPAFSDAHNNLGVAYDRLAQWADAEASFRQALALSPDHADAARNLGLVLSKRGAPSAAAAALERAAQLLPSDATVYADLGAAQLAAGEPAAAAHSLGQALQLDPALSGTAANLGEALRRLGQLDAARTAFERALELDPRIAEAHLGIGRVAAARGDVTVAVRSLSAAGGAGGNVRLALQAAAELEVLGAADAALECLRSAAGVSPADADLQDAHGALLHRLGRFAEALDCYERALQIDEHRVPTLLNCGRAYESMGALDRARGCFEQVLSLRPADPSAMASMASGAFRVCDWDLAADMLARLRESPAGIDALPAFLMLASPLTPAEVAESSRRRARATVWPAAPPGLAQAGVGGDPLRVAYLSPDFGAHPVAYAIAGLIERHDRARISPVGVSLKAADASPIGTRLQGAFDAFIDASALSDRALVELLRNRGIDVAIDLAGLTTGARTAIFAMRAAPVQINFLGFPGSMGMDFIDYLIADPIVVPPAQAEFYSEKVLRMPHTYLPFDDRRTLPAAGMSREAAGLPSAGFVFCAFSNGYKITREMFGVWMSLLRDVPDSVLWLRRMGPAAEANLGRAAQRAGLSTDRLIFAPFEATMEGHLARLRLADLFLDTLPYNAHTTAAEALWLQVPVITCPGAEFAGRVGASLLTACRLPELVCADLSSYQMLATQIARSPERCEELRAHLRREHTGPAFDTESYTRSFEALLVEAARRGPAD